MPQKDLITLGCQFYPPSRGNEYELKIFITGKRTARKGE